MKVLFNRISGLGDILMSTAVVREFRKQNPDAEIIYRTNRPEILENNPDINKVILSNTPLKEISEDEKSIYDKIIDLDFAVESVGVSKLGKISDADYMNITRLDLLFRHAQVKLPKYPKLVYNLTTEEEQSAKNIKSTLKGNYTVVLVLNSTSPVRTYPIDLSVELINILLAQKINVIVVGDSYRLWTDSHPFNEYYNHCIQRFDKNYFLNLVGKCRIREVAALIANSNLTITGDTGPLHITNAVSVPCIAIFGNIDPKLRCYYYDNVVSIFNNLKCAVCGDRHSVLSNICNCYKDILNTNIRRIGADCVRSITPQQIFHKAMEILGIYTDNVSNSETSRMRQYVLPYCYGKGLDIGAVGGNGNTTYEYAIKHDSTVVDLRPARKPSILSDARKLDKVQSRSQDYVYSSHMLEDLINEDILPTLNEWLRVIKSNGNLIIYCPVQPVYKRHCEITNQPLNTDHKVEHFSLRYVKNKLKKCQYNYEILQEIQLINNYSFLLVIRKK